MGKLFKITFKSSSTIDSSLISNRNLNRKGLDKALEDNLETLRRRGYKPGLKDLKIDKASKKQWVQDQVDAIQFRTKEFKDLMFL